MPWAKKDGLSCSAADTLVVVLAMMEIKKVSPHSPSVIPSGVHASNCEACAQSKDPYELINPEERAWLDHAGYRMHSWR